MPSATPAVDLSVRWRCECRYQHAPAAPCPRPGVWLVLATCRDCLPRHGLYCTRHR
jgi:hypothetical protein